MAKIFSIFLLATFLAAGNCGGPTPPPPPPPPPPGPPVPIPQTLVDDDKNFYQDKTSFAIPFQGAGSVKIIGDIGPQTINIDPTDFKLEGDFEFSDTYVCNGPGDCYYDLRYASGVGPKKNALRGLFAHYQLKQRQDFNAANNAGKLKSAVNLSTVLRDQRRAELAAKLIVTNPKYADYNAASAYLISFGSKNDTIKDWLPRLKLTRDWTGAGPAKTQLQERVIKVANSIADLIKKHSADQEWINRFNDIVGGLEAPGKCPDAAVDALSQLEFIIQSTSIEDFPEDDREKYLLSLAIQAYLNATFTDLVKAASKSESGVEGVILLRTWLSGPLGLGNQITTPNFCFQGIQELKKTLYASLEQIFGLLQPENLELFIANWTVSGVVLDEGELGTALLPWENHMKTVLKAEWKAIEDQYGKIPFDPAATRAAVIAFRRKIKEELPARLKKAGYEVDRPEYSPPASWD